LVGNFPGDKRGGFFGGVVVEFLGFGVFYEFLFDFL
jgi:hypothetical protein